MSEGTQEVQPESSPETPPGNPFAERLKLRRGESDEPIVEAPQESVPDVQPEQLQGGDNDGLRNEGQENAVQEEGQEEKVKDLPPKGSRARREHDRAERMKEEAAEARAKAEQAQLELQKLQIQMQNMQEAIDLVGKGAAPQGGQDVDQDKILRDAGFDPDEIIDKDFAVKMLQQNQTTQQQTQQAQQKAEASAYENSVNTTLASLGDNKKHVEAAINHLINVQAKTIQVNAGLSGQKLTEQQAIDAAAEEVNRAGFEVYRNNQNPVTWAWEMAKSYGFNTQALQNPPQPAKNKVEDLQRARDMAGMPEISPVQAKYADGAETGAKFKQHLQKRRKKSS